jgi:hypothetical protein
MNKLFMLATLMCCGMLLTSCSKDDKNDGGSNTEGEVVLMYYALGGSDLDMSTEQALANIAFYRKQYPNVRSFVQFKYSKERNKRWGTDYEPSGNYGEVYRFELNDNSLNPKYNGDVEEVKAFTGKGFQRIAGSDFKMYEPANIADFINWCIEQAPNAKAYVLAFGDHGGGYDLMKDGVKTRGVMYDDNIEGGPCASNTEIATAIDAAKKHINVVFYDCCIMNNLEALGELVGHTDYVFASGHSVAQNPLPDLCLALSKIPSAGTIDAGIRQHLGSYVNPALENMRRMHMKYISENRIGRSMDYTLTDMSKLPALFASIKAVSDYLKQYVATLSPAELTARQDDFSEAASDCYQYTNTDPLYDVVSYLNALENHVFANVDQFDALVANVETAAKQCQVAHAEYSINKDGTDRKYGLSYSIILGFNSKRLRPTAEVSSAHPIAEQGVIMHVVRAGKGDIDDPYYNAFLLENGNVYFSVWNSGQEDRVLDINNYSQMYSTPDNSWDKHYYTTVFDKATGWSGWFKLNPGIPYDNPPSDDEGNWVFENPNINDIINGNVNIWQ